MPVAPDPFWPAGAAPRHLSVAERSDVGVVSAYKNVLSGNWKCAKCGSTVDQSEDDRTLCKTCSRSKGQNTAMAKRVNSGWMELAEQLGLELYERQPEESDLEWRIWEKYRSYYPLKLPTYNELATAVGCATATAVKAAQKWSFKVRMVAWAQFTDSDVQEKRVKAIREMNEKQLQMAETMQEKLSDAINYLQPELLKPNEIVNMFKMATELERKITAYVEETVDNKVTEHKGAGNQEKTKPEDMTQILEILNKAGAFKGKTVGVEQTTRIITKGDDDN